IPLQLAVQDGLELLGVKGGVSGVKDKCLHRRPPHDSTDLGCQYRSQSFLIGRTQVRTVPQTGVRETGFPPVAVSTSSSGPEPLRHTERRPVRSRRKPLLSLSRPSISASPCPEPDSDLLLTFFSKH